MSDQINSKISQVASKKGISQSEVQWQIKLSDLELKNENGFYCFQPYSQMQMYTVMSYKEINNGYIEQLNDT